MIPNAFKQKDYNTIINALDEAVEVMIEAGHTIEEAQELLKDFIDNHYWKVWRRLVTQTMIRKSVTRSDVDIERGLA